MLKRVASLFALALLFCVSACAQDILPITPPELESLIAKNKGKVVIVDFFATWCPPCREEIPGFVKLQSKYGDKDLAIIGVSVDEGKTSVVEDFAKDMGINYPTYHGGGAVARKYRIRAIPTTTIYGKTGEKVKTHIGFVAEAEFDRQIASLLK